MTPDHFWKEFFRLKVHVNYLELQLGRTEAIDRALKMFLACTSVGSIGAWAIWKDLAFFWGLLIATSQVLNAIRQYLPYKDRLRALSGLLNDLEDIALSTETKWLEIATGNLGTEEIKKALSDIRTRRLKAFRKHFPASVIPENKALFQKAEEKALIYFENFYGSDSEQ